MQVIPWRSAAKIRSSLQTVVGWSWLAARHPGSHPHFLSSWGQNEVEKLTGHAGVIKDKNLLHHMALLGCRAVHAWVPGAPSLPTLSGSSQGSVPFVPRSLGSVLPLLRPVSPEALSQPCAVRLPRGIGLPSPRSRAGLCALSTDTR